jgi:hypothetical protein
VGFLGGVSGGSTAAGAASGPLFAFGARHQLAYHVAQRPAKFVHPLEPLFARELGLEDGLLLRLEAFGVADIGGRNERCQVLAKWDGWLCHGYTTLAAKAG